ncbi:hypothetical protein ESCO_000151 [Escovopsis weberi]|uniref:Uncharacterized protein n=1 Tax=Escovopsis weberi TaxID=150374 RepID=A0A0M8N2F9_ESCWE|nr:hypothetical protein ESCO_000151 [Escovopsis weberi]
MLPATRRRSARLAHTAPKITITAPEPASATSKTQSPVRETLMSNNRAATPRATPATPASAVPKPPSTEMHPSKFQQTSFAPSSALELGFSDIKDPRRRDSTHGSGIDSTPSRIGGVSASAFSFRVKPPNWTWEKNTKAQEVMAGLKGDVAKFKAELVAAQKEAGQSSPSNPAPGERTFARPRSKTGRFSAAHLAEFKKMDSIEGHASAWRAQNAKFTPAKPAPAGASKSTLDVSPTPHKSNSKRIPTKLPAPEAAPNDRSRFGLKRKQSAAQIGGGQTPKKPEGANRSRSPALLSKQTVSSSAKRLKQNAGDDASTTRPKNQDEDATPKPPSTASLSE